ncbi:MAG: ImmA/IrrE family metallo-endopeptidase [Helicobacteraceae bacterium]|nr:ImmA/IrrE family metallo-endopeptidase [Helicobacteraceae bacterium]
MRSEIGHFVERQKEEAFEYIDYRNNIKSVSERFANKFAANLLMPENAVRKLHTAGISFDVLLTHFKESTEALAIRFLELNLNADIG